MAMFQELPVELIEHILSYLDVAPLSIKKVWEEPSHGMFRSEDQPLKNFSLTNRSLRHISTKFLFHHIFIQASKSLDELYDLMQKYGITGNSIQTVVLQDTTVLVQCKTHILKFMKSLLEFVKPSTLTLALHPATLAGLLPQSDIPTQHACLFIGPFQILQLKCDPRDLSCIKAVINPGKPSVLQLRPWTELIFNEGSHVPAYSTYEYFNLKMPSWIPHYLDVPFLTDGSFLQQQLSENIQCFTYIALFPYVDLNNLCDFVNGLFLQVFRIQLGPSANHNSNSGRADHKDLWMEFETSCHAVARSMSHPIPSSPDEMHLLDVRNKDLHGILDMHFNPEEMQGWRFCGDGICVKEATP